MIDNLKSFDVRIFVLTIAYYLTNISQPFAEADEEGTGTIGKESQNYIHIRIQRKFAFRYHVRIIPDFVAQNAMVVKH